MGFMPSVPQFFWVHIRVKAAGLVHIAGGLQAGDWQQSWGTDVTGTYSFCPLSPHIAVPGNCFLTTLWNLPLDSATLSTSEQKVISLGKVSPNLFFS